MGKAKDIVEAGASTSDEAVGGAPVRPCRILDAVPVADGTADVILVCPWLKGLSAGEGLWLSALSVHDCNAVFEEGWTFEGDPALRARCFFGVFALDRLRSANRLLSLLRERGVDAIVNLPSVTFFDGAMEASLTALGFDLAAERRFLAKARDHGIRTACCEREGAPFEHGGKHRILHAGPGSKVIFKSD